MAIAGGSRIEESQFAGQFVRPGDKLILTFSGALTMSECDRIREQAKSLLPDVEIVVFDHVTGMAVYRPDGERM